MSEQKPVEQTPAAEPEKLEEVAVGGDKPVETPVVATAAAKIEEASAESEVKVPEPPTKTEESAKVDEPAQQAAPAATTTETEPSNPEEKQPEKPAYLTNIPSLSEFFDRLPAIISKTGHSEMWGVPLKGNDDIPTVNVLIKFLRANEGNLQAAEEQLRKALEWRKQTDPLALIESGRYSAARYGGLGYLTTYEQDGRPLVFTWNIYGAVKDMTATFADSDEFVKWRAALMELAVQDLQMKDATTVIDYDGEKDPYQMIQVHDYLNVKFFRIDPALRAATKKTIDVFSTAYPELLREKFFVNVPAIMGWMFSAMKLILSRNTTRKFHPISNGANLAREFQAAVAEKIPKTYGGQGPELKEVARTVKLVEEGEKMEKTAVTENSGETSAPEAPAETEDTPQKEAVNTAPTKDEPAQEVASKETTNGPKDDVKEAPKEEPKVAAEGVSEEAT